MRLPPDMLITIDGGVACGKSTLARLLAETLGYSCLNTGAMYRAVALYAQQNGLHKDAQRLTAELPHIHIAFDATRKVVLLNGRDVTNQLSSVGVAQLASHIAQWPSVREFCVDLQRKIAANKGYICEGRDMGTVVFPDAEVKFFLTASPVVRARRRQAELSAVHAEQTTLDEILLHLRERDKNDQTRALSPLRPATDAKIIDNSTLDIPTQIQIMVEYIVQKRQNR